MRANLKSLLILTCVMPFCRFALAQDSTVMPAAQTPAAGQEYLADPKFQKALADAKERKPMTADEHMARWKHAAKMSQNKCVECLHEVLRFQVKELQWKDAVSTAKIMEEVATDPREKVFAETNHGQALMQMNDGKPKPDQLKEADTAFQAALALAPKHKNALFHGGRAEAMLGNDEGAKALFERYLQGASYSDTYRTRVEHFVENPKLAAMPMAPPFTFTTSEGEQISLDDMNGKVVLVDFWATWCGPCKEALPTIKKIAKEFQGQPLVVVSISIDRDDIAWKNFIAKNEMTWAQYRDANGALSNAYGAQSIPRTFTIDTDGVLKSVKVGSDSDPEGDVKKLVKKAVEAEKKKAMTTDKAATD